MDSRHPWRFNKTFITSANMIARCIRQTSDSDFLNRPGKQSERELFVQKGYLSERFEDPPVNYGLNKATLSHSSHWGRLV